MATSNLAPVPVTFVLTVHVAPEYLPLARRLTALAEPSVVETDAAAAFILAAIQEVVHFPVTPMRPHIRVVA